MKRVVLKIIAVVWIVLWVVFIARELFVKGGAREYAALLGRPLEGKHAYVTGDELYGFIDFCRTAIPESATFAVEGLEKDSHDKRRFTYYLYPRMERPDADFICVYRLPERPRDGYRVAGTLAGKGYILIKARGTD